MNTNAEKAKMAIEKMLADKAEWEKCVKEGKPLSSLKDKGINLLKLQ